jgi:tetrapyrrole methylase family protein / MazG family protein
MNSPQPLNDLLTPDSNQQHPPGFPVNEARWGELPPANDLTESLLTLCQVVAKLRGPGGCPWDRAQTLSTIVPHTIEETFELVEAIEAGHDKDIIEELGDVLLQVLLDSQIAADEQRFDLVDVAKGLTAKLIRRHPHVFGDVKVTTADEVHRNWAAIKSTEKERMSIFDGLPIELPALSKAARLSAKAAAQGYDFPQREMLFDKLTEELRELSVELFETDEPPCVQAGVLAERITDEQLPPERKARATSELGDVLFVVANIARRYGIDPEAALRASNRKFERRVRAIETAIGSQGRAMRDVSLTELEEVYQAAKRGEQSLPR